MATPRVCVVGAGRWGKNHVQTLHGLGTLAGVVEVSDEGRSWLAQRYPNTPVFHSLAEALNQNFDGFTVATPAATHVAVASQIIEAGKPLLVEKPLALTSGEARQLKELAKKKGVPLMVGHVLLFHPAIRKIKALIQANQLGRIQYIYSNRLNLGTVRTEENILWSFAPHDISIFDYLLEADPEEVLARGAAILQPTIHDSMMTMLRYPGNVVGHIFVSWLHPFKEHKLVIVGSKGMLTFEDRASDSRLILHEKGIDWIEGEPQKREGPAQEIEFEKLMPLTEELKYFCENLASKHIAIANGESGVKVLEILERAMATLPDFTSGNDKVVSLPSKPKKDFFVHESSYIDENAEVGEGTKIWHFCNIMKNTSIGKNCTIGQNVVICPNVKVGNNVKIQNNVSLYEGVELGDFVFCGPSMVFTNVIDPRCKYPQRGTEFYRKTIVGEGASFGANCTIVCGHTIGKHAFIAAGATVTKDVPPYAVVAGCPARQIGWMCECGEQLRSFSADGGTTCPRCSLQYTLEQGRLSRVVSEIVRAAND